MSYFLDSHYAAHPMSPFHPFDHLNLPKVGQTRCYWALLSAELQFIHLDPVLAFHLDAQADILVGQSLLRFVHPDERASAKQDLGGVLESRTLHGSVTRVRFSRLSKVRRDLGYDGPIHPWADADKIALDDNYMAVDIVINWAAEGLVLCFIHATADLTPNDNDELNKTDWSNWCGTPLMDPEQTELLYSRLLVCIPRPPTTTRVFQILAHKPGRPLLLSWPPDQDQPPTGREFAALVENVQIGINLPNGNDAKTSCTRRYRASQPMPAALGPDGGEVESIFIPHGSIIFACHKVNPPVRALPAAMQQYSTLNYNPPTHSFYEQQASYALPPLATTAYNNNYMAQGPVDPNYSSTRWPQASGEPSSYAQWPSPSPPNSASPLPSGSLRSVSYPPPATPNQQWQQQPVPPAPYIDTVNAPQPSFNRSLSPTYPREAESNSAAPSPGADVVPAPRRRVSPGSSREYSTGRGSHRPSGVLKCSSCKTTTSPEWRKGPSGKKELCNACGLRYARSRAKKDPNNSQRRKKDKGGVSKRDHSTPPVALPSSYTTLRRSYGDASSFTSSAGSPSGSDVYSHSGAHGTPSPSPPASGSMSFVHYSPAEGRAGPGTSTGGFYAVPSPLSNPPVVLQQAEDSAPHHQQQRHMNQLPPLMSGYQDRVSPTLPTQMMAQASYERDRERELPPTPLSAEPRHSRRSILTQQ